MFKILAEIMSEECYVFENINTINRNNILGVNTKTRRVEENCQTFQSRAKYSISVGIIQGIYCIIPVMAPEYYIGTPSFIDIYVLLIAPKIIGVSYRPGFGEMIEW